MTERMGGHLEVSSKWGHGSCFSLHLNAADPAILGEAVTAQWSSPNHAHSGFMDLQETPGSFHVLYVEDNPVNVVLMRGILDALAEVRCTDAPSGALGEALAMADRPDLLLLDRHLPDIDGLQLLAKLRKHPRLSDVPAVMVSADAMPEDIREAMAAGFADYWVKPLNITQTQAAMRILLGRKPTVR
ncbi:MAG: response regulator [Rhizobacter sp.]